MPGLEISIRKRIPVCAGMAGGSTDAAAVLRALNEKEGNPFSMEELARVGEGVGSDVPYCVLGGTALAEGRGEMLTPLPPLPRCWVAVCKPDFPSPRQSCLRTHRRDAGPLPARHRRTARQRWRRGTCLVWPGACTTCLRKCCRSGRR